MLGRAAVLTLLSVGCLALGAQTASATRRDLAFPTATGLTTAFGSVVGSSTDTGTGAAVASKVDYATRVYQCTTPRGCGSGGIISAAAGTFTYVYQLQYSAAATATDVVGGLGWGTNLFDRGKNFGVLTGLSSGLVGTLADPTFGANVTWALTADNGFAPGATLVVYFQSASGPGKIEFLTKDPNGTSTAGAGVGPVAQPSSRMLLVGGGIMLSGGLVGRFIARKRTGKTGGLGGA